MVHNRFYVPVPFPSRPEPAIYTEGRGWYQRDAFGALKKRRVRKPYYHLIWPKDGRNGSKFGRFKDIMTNHGPDIHLAISADKYDYMHNRPLKNRWARHTNIDNSGRDGALKVKMPWIKRDSADAYDFRTREWKKPYRDMWTDALWPSTPDKYFDYPYAIRDVYGNWSQHNPHMQAWPEDEYDPWV